MRKANTILLPNTIQNIPDGIEECVGGFVVLGLDPFSLEYSPYGFSFVKMWRIWRKVDDAKPLFLPLNSFGLDFFALVEARIIQYEDGTAVKAINDAVNVFDKAVGVYVFSRGEAMIFIVTADHPEDIKTRGLFGGDADILIRELPSIWYIPTGADMRLITIKKFDKSFIVKIFKFLQYLGEQLIVLRRGVSPSA